MDLSTRLVDLQRKVAAHREILLTEQAAKTALVMPFIQSLGYDVFNPGEVIPEFTADVGTKKGEKVDYAICKDGKISILIECKPSTSDLSINHAGQLFRYFSVTDARLAILTNGVMYQFYSDIDRPNKMDDKPFYTFSIEAIKPSDPKVLEKFTKPLFDIDQIVEEAVNLKTQSQLRKELEKEFNDPSEELVRMLASRVYGGRLTPAIKESFSRILPAVIANLIRDLVNERLSSALNAATPEIPDVAGNDSDDGAVITTTEEISGFHIIQAIVSRITNPKRVVIRDAKSYCAVLLDDNNRKTIARLHFNGVTTKHLGLFDGKEEAKHPLSDLTEIYQYTSQIEARLRELDPSIPLPASG